MKTVWKMRLMASALVSVGMLSTTGLVFAEQGKAQTSTQSSAQSSEQVSSPLIKQLDAIASKYYPADQPGASVLVMKEGKVLLRKGYGLAKVEDKQVIRPEYVFRLGSITKQFTAVAIMQLVDQGKLSLDDPLTKFFPEFTETAKKVTVEHLLTHTSGIPSYTSKPGFIAMMGQDRTVQQMLEMMRRDRLEFEPGSAWKYNNSGYFILGAIIENVSGETYADYVAKHIFEPLGMRDSAYEGYARSKQTSVSGYTAKDKNFQLTPTISMTIPYAAGALTSNVDDMAKWDSAIASGKLLKAESWKRVFTDYRLSSGQTTNYGYGWEIGALEGKKMYAHSGGINGFRTHALSLPTEKIYAVVLVNADSGVADPEVLASRLAAAAMGKTIPEFKAIQLDTKILDQYVGVYKIDEKNRRFVTREGNQLVMTRSNGPRTVFQAYSENGFFQSQDSLLRVEFNKNERGQVSELLVHQRGNITAHSRLDEALPPVEKAFPMSAAQFDRFVGEYELMPNFVLTIRREGDRFLAKATGQGDTVLMPIALDTLKSDSVNATLRFVKDANEQITHLILTQNGVSREAKKIR